MRVYLVFSAFTFRPTSLLLSIRTSVLFLDICYLPTDLYHQHRPAADASHLISISSVSFWTFLMVKFKSNDDKASPCFRPFCVRNVSDKYLPIRTLLQVSFKHILISLNIFIGAPNSIRILYNTSLLTES
jgi:hypothetical protein